jgi:ABC-type branched-subunit amino acid transport system substrate-binding protein
VHDKREFPERLDSLSRRRLLKQAGIFAVSAGPAAGLLAACGSDDKDAASSTSSGSTTSAATTDELATILGTPTGEAAGAGLAIKIGASASLSGGGATAYGTEQVRGMKLAIQHIEAAGGPKFDFMPRDNGTGNTAKTPGYMRELGAAKVPVLLTSQSANASAELPFFKQYQMLGLDGGAAAAGALNPTDYYYIMTTVTGLQTPGILEYVKQTSPEVKRVSSLLLDLGGPFMEGWRKFVSGAVVPAGYEDAGEVTYSDFAQTDFSPQLAKLKSQNPEAILVTMFGGQMGTFMKQFVASGIDAQVYGYDWTPDCGKAGGSAMSEYRFSGCYFDPTTVTSDWEKLYVKDFTAANGAPPTTFSTIYYENTFHVWELVMQIIKDGGDPTAPGAHWVEALEAHPTFFAARGGEGSKPGSVEMDLESHVFKHQLNVMAESNVLPTKPSIIATFDLDGSNYKAV